MPAVHGSSTQQSAALGLEACAVPLAFPRLPIRVDIDVLPEAVLERMTYMLDTPGATCRPDRCMWTLYGM